MSTAGTTATRRDHLLALDVVRVLAVAMVVGVHTLSFGPARTTVLIGAFIMIFHSSREVFFLITAFALTYSYGRRAVRWRSFWRRRFVLVLAPYVAWSLIYFFADGSRLDPLSTAIWAFARDLANGGARYHLYFLLVSMQIYLVFPLLRALVAKTQGHHGGLLMLASVYQLAVTLAIHSHHTGAGPLAFWLKNPNQLLPSYGLYVIAGALGAWHLEQLTTFTRRHRRVVVSAFGVGVAGGVGIYLVAALLAGESPVTASAVFQPAVVLESLAIAWAFYALGLAWEDAGAPRRAFVSAGAENSFGIFLSHPLILQGILALGTTTGVLAALRRTPGPVELVLLLGVVVPAIYVAGGALTAAARWTPLSLVLTGRAAPSALRRLRFANREAPTGPPSEEAGARPESRASSSLTFSAPAASQQHH